MARSPCRAKARGVKLGGPNLVEAGNAAAKTVESNVDRRAANVLPIIQAIRFYESFI